jgi:hypothetical protein
MVTSSIAFLTYHYAYVNIYARYVQPLSSDVPAPSDPEIEHAHEGAVMHSNRRLCEFAALLCLASAIAAFPITLISPFNAGFMTVYLPVTVVMTLNVIFTIEGVISAKRRMMAREEHEAGDDIRWNSAMLNITLEVALVLCVWGFCHISGYTHYQNFIYLMWYCVGSISLPSSTRAVPDGAKPQPTAASTGAAATTPTRASLYP